ncbi:Protein of unknown function [Colwellia chukchiensis]|uniref:DUF3307 domain-containing protein n=1 Tax=Colwellia chukchiensis TaxID=641665 RepID=A0A1H7Q9P1_9GAMM|nr:DUF3307 domain-containing protein [Colwellia chukchiensis]SEL44448.1 Protein of unknown function [Colwellia chukchiensis]
MILLLLMLTTHFISDFYLQPISSVTERDNHALKRYQLWLHFFVYSLLLFLVLFAAELSLLTALTALAIIMSSHALNLFWRYKRRKTLRNFLLTQVLQLVVISLVWAQLSNISLSQALLFIQHIFNTKNIIIVLAYLLACQPASIVISLALKKHTDKLTKPTDKQCQHNQNDKAIGLLSAGAWIGYIERCLAISFIFMGQFAGIGFLVATKTIFRFGDLTQQKDMKLTEYMMLGTLLSYAIAIFIGWNAKQLYFAL